MRRSIDLRNYPMGHPPMLAWLRGNGLDTARLPYDQTVEVEDGLLTAVYFVPAEIGSSRRIKIVSGEPDTEPITVSLISAPETHGL